MFNGGGSPVATDRLLATSFGCKAIDLVVENKWGRFLAYENHGIVPKNFNVVLKGKKKLPLEYYKMATKFFR